MSPMAFLAAFPLVNTGAYSYALPRNLRRTGSIPWWFNGTAATARSPASRQTISASNRPFGTGLQLERAESSRPFR